MGWLYFWFIANVFMCALNAWIGTLGSAGNFGVAVFNGFVAAWLLTIIAKERA